MVSKKNLPFFKPVEDDVESKVDGFLDKINDTKNDDNDSDSSVPDYDDIGNIENISSSDDIMDKTHNGIDNLPIGHQLKPVYETNEHDEPIIPEQLGTVLTKYRVEAEVPNAQKKDFEVNRSFHGRHVALSNTRRIDNIRHLDAQDLCNIFDRIPTMRHLATLIRMRETAEFQMCRSNPEIGGFEAKIGVTNIRREDVDVRQTQSLFDGDKKKKKSKGMWSFLKGGG